MIHFALLVVIEFNGCHAIIHCHLHSNGVCLPLLPMLLCKAIATLLDNCNSKAALLKGLSGHVVSLSILKDNFVLFKGIQILFGLGVE